MARLLTLPIELLTSLPDFIHNIEDFTNAASSCRRLRDAFANTSPRRILHLAAASAPTFFSPHPEFLTLATARQVSDWAIGNNERTKQLDTSLLEGMGGLYELCLEKAGLFMEDIRRLHRARFDVVNQFADKIDKMAGQQWTETPKFWSGGVSEPYEIECHSTTATYQFLIYGELFASTMESFLAPQKNLPILGFDTRIEYIKYCIPDWACHKGYPGFKVQQTGPYAGPHEEKYILDGDQLALYYTLGCGRWKRMWSAITTQIGPDFQDVWRQKLFANAVQLQGLEVAELVTTYETDEGLSSSWRLRLSAIRTRVEELEYADRSDKAIPTPPNLRYELLVCCAAVWPPGRYLSLPNIDSQTY